MKVNGTNISMIRGDSESFMVSCVDSDGIDLPFQVGDIIYFTVKQNTKTETIILQKTIEEFTADGKALIPIAPSDTKNLKYGTYVYDVQWTRDNGAVVTTIVSPSKFVIGDEVTYE